MKTVFVLSKSIALFSDMIRTSEVRDFKILLTSSGCLARQEFEKMAPQFVFVDGELLQEGREVIDFLDHLHAKKFSGIVVAIGSPADPHIRACIMTNRINVCESDLTRISSLWSEKYRSLDTE